MGLRVFLFMLASSVDTVPCSVDVNMSCILYITKHTPAWTWYSTPHERYMIQCNMCACNRFPLLLTPRISTTITKTFPETPAPPNHPAPFKTDFKWENRNTKTSLMTVELGFRGPLLFALRGRDYFRFPNLYIESALN